MSLLLKAIKLITQWEGWSSKDFIYLSSFVLSSVCANCLWSEKHEGKGTEKASEESFILTLGMILHLLSEGTISNIPVLEPMIKSTFSFDSKKKKKGMQAITKKEISQCLVFRLWTNEWHSTRQCESGCPLGFCVVRTPRTGSPVMGSHHGDELVNRLHNLHVRQLRFQVF